MKKKKNIKIFVHFIMNGINNGKTNCLKSNCEDFPGLIMLHKWSYDKKSQG